MMWRIQQKKKKSENVLNLIYYLVLIYFLFFYLSYAFSLSFWIAGKGSLSWGRISRPFSRRNIWEAMHPMSLWQEAVECYIHKFLTYFIFAFGLFKYYDAEEMYFMKFCLILFYFCLQ